MAFMKAEFSKIYITLHYRLFLFSNYLFNPFVSNLIYYNYICSVFGWDTKSSGYGYYIKNSRYGYFTDLYPSTYTKI